MISKLDEVMVYVNDPRAMADFWINKIGFVKILEVPYGENTCFITVAPSADSATRVTLHDKAFISQMQPMLTLATPSLLFKTEDIEGFHKTLKEKGVNVGDLVDMGGLTFNFSDPEGNYFATR